MKPSRFEGQISQTTPPKHGMAGMRAQLTPLSRSTGKLSFTCPVCNLVFERYASQARGAIVHCSRPCSGISRRNRYQIACDVCGNPRTITPSIKAKNKYYLTCGNPACFSLLWKLPNIAGRPSPHKAYKNARAKVILDHRKCSCCGTEETELWFVRGITFDGEYCATESATLLCGDCHLSNLNSTNHRNAPPII